MSRSHQSASTRVAGCDDFLQANRLGRRQVLQAGCLGSLGLGLDFLAGARSLAASTDKPAAGTLAGFGRAKACIFLFMWGGPSQLDTFDLKPDGPDEIRGPFKPIATSVPGIQICEHFGQVAKVADKLSIIRSLTHNDPAHLSSGHTALTGHLAPVVNSDAEPPSQRDTPHMGSVVARLKATGGAIPPFVTLPWLVWHSAAPGGRAPGQNGGWLGSRYDPMILSGDPNAADWRVAELALHDDISLDRMADRQALLATIDQQRRIADRAAAAAGGGFRQQAFELLAGAKARQAFDLSAEPAAVRDRYGRHIHGQSVLLARRLVEHGVSLVSVNWHNDGRNFWDTHGNNFNRLKNDLIPPADQALSALLTDLDERGLLDETIVAWVGEFGRKPRISAENAGRDHWPRCYSGLLAGGGIRGGAVYGASDSQGAYPADLACSPQDYAATIYHALGIDPRMHFADAQGRPLAICQGRPLAGLFA